MKVTAEDFRHQYADLSDEALLDIERQELVELARKCYDEELARRKLNTTMPAPVAKRPPEPAPQRAAPAPERAAPAPERPAPAARRAPEPDEEDEELVAAETYDSPEAARLARELLRANGIRAVLGTEGLEVLVPASTQEAAQAVLISEISDETLAASAANFPSYIRPGRGTTQPYLCGSVGLIAFVQHIFGVREVERFDLGPGLVRVDVGTQSYRLALEIADSPSAGAVPGSVYVYVPDVDDTYSRALNNGAEEIAPPEDQPYGERVAAVRDSFGNTWWIATYLSD